MEHVEEVVGLTHRLTKANMERDLEKFTSFHTRYYKSQTGIESATWLYNQVQTVIEQSGAAEHGATVDRFAHSWGQFSIIARIPGKSNKTVVLGAHQDSINLFLPSILAAPGADDDGSGTVTILEALRGLLQSDTVAQGKAPNTIEFHWYSAEEGGMLGSQAIFSQYKQERRDIKAMLQQDMTGYVQGALNAGRKEAVGIMIDYVDRGLTQFLKDVVTAVSPPNRPTSTHTGSLTMSPSIAMLGISRRNVATLAPTIHQQVNMATPRPWLPRRRWRTPTRGSTPPMTGLNT
ncbi:unnamed protein product [Aspergillus oryzae]|uniref:Peptide hydrolase n=2 Tax=Aspergillus oryzae TaxID=5062 RepID=A0AAN4YT44_ASPOZ|nr:unnamed protein product [Aspergillus oryzae]GMF94096.1 unnamed protein product [Aspergillus oryzae]GMG10162.1 unnamed protein product [Aspergillus oryzae]GMG36820.1 unnamed protein product [Aspergillus oryzae]GMG51946.1 unnamed protein product [Aspergillus oryzae var. brunneus]